MDMPLKKPNIENHLSCFVYDKRLKWQNLTFSIALFFFFVDPKSNNKYDSFSNLDKVIISLGIRDRPEKGLPR